ncbi:MAG: hypothetical protein JNL94_00025 [Planctomycetes bacterium]|nr:hypothetical protein [Planctomycetota bacterium]
MTSPWSPLVPLVAVVALALGGDPVERAWRALHDADDPRAALAALDDVRDVDPASARGLRVQLLRLAAHARLGDDPTVRDQALALRERAARSPLLAQELDDLLDATATTTAQFASTWFTLASGDAYSLDLALRVDAATHASLVDVEHVDGLVRARSSIHPTDALAIDDASPEPWRAMITRGGRGAWIRVHDAGDPALIEAIVARDAGATPIAAPRAVFAHGRGNAIEVCFELDRTATAARIERASARDGAFVTVAAAATSPFVDASAPHGVALAYRVTALSTDGRESVPMSCGATTHSTGTCTGSIEFEVRDGRGVPTGGGVADGVELTLTAVDARAAAFCDAFGRRVGVGATLEQPFTYDDARPIPASIPFVVPRRFGGAVVARWIAVDDDTVRVDYAGTLDRAPRPEPPTLVVDDVGDAIVLSVSTQDGAACDDVIVEDARSGSVRARLRAIDGRVVDDAPSPGRWTYSVRCVGADGRTSLPTEVTLDWPAPPRLRRDAQPEPPPFIPPSSNTAESWHDALDALEAAWSQELERTEGVRSNVAALLGRRHALDLGLDRDAAYALATYSFVHGERRPLPKIGNRWELQHGNTPGQIHVRMSTDQANALARVGVVPWPLRPADVETAPTIGERSAIRVGDVFVECVASKASSIEPFYVAFQVLALEDSDVLVVRWERVDDSRAAALDVWFSSDR